MEGGGREGRKEGCLIVERSSSSRPSSSVPLPTRARHGETRPSTPSPSTSSSLQPSVDHAGGGADVLHAVQAEDVSQVGEQHQRRRLQLQLLPTQDRALRRYA